uniref:Putative F-box domain, Leucine-rich repeat domain, L domain-like protein n=1 Tax=Helianthus annuus TaxID=4232 RepID=A0A251UAE7_HELAN
MENCQFWRVILLLLYFNKTNTHWPFHLDYISLILLKLSITKAISWFQMDWNEFPVHCLVQVLTRVGMESLVQTVPLVCKSWYDATFYPQCWQRLLFHKSPYNLQTPKSSWLGFGLLHQHTEEDALEKFLHFAVGRSHGLVTELIFPSQSRLKEGQIAWIAQRCPSLKLLVLPNHLSYVINFEVSSSICKWKDLEGLQISSLIGLKTTIANISKNCPKFSHLSAYVPRLDGDVALAIASQLPHIRTLDLRFSTIQRHDLLLILKGCQKLEHLHISDHADDDILQVAPHVRVFKHLN